MDPIELWTALLCTEVVALTLLAGALGAIGGFAHHVATPPEPGAEPRRWWANLVAGAVAAVAILYIASPESPIALISGSLVAGYGGIALMGALSARIVAATASQRARESAADLKTALAALEEAATALAGARSPESTSMAERVRATCEALSARRASGGR
jgi:predicted benzoate:H+ symporter BenE